MFGSFYRWVYIYQWPGKATGETKNKKNTKQNSSQSTKPKCGCQDTISSKCRFFHMLKKGGSGGGKFDKNFIGGQYSWDLYTDQVLWNSVQQNRRNHSLKFILLTVYIPTYLPPNTYIPPLRPILQPLNLRTYKRYIKSIYVYQKYSYRQV